MTVLFADAVLVITTRASFRLAYSALLLSTCPVSSPPSNWHTRSLELPVVLIPQQVHSDLTPGCPSQLRIHERCQLSRGMALYAWAETGDFVCHSAAIIRRSYPRVHIPYYLRKLLVAWSLGMGLSFPLPSCPKDKVPKFRHGAEGQ